MKEVHIRAGYTNNPRLVAAFLEAIESAQKVSVRAYTTSILVHTKPYLVTTGSKEIHLRLGEMGTDARAAMMTLIDSETEIDSHLVVTHSPVTAQKRSYLCVVDRPANGLTHVIMSPIN